jgi:hypothetical protein
MPQIALCVACGDPVDKDYGTTNIPRMAGRCVVCSAVCENCAFCAGVWQSMVCANENSPKAGQVVVAGDGCLLYTPPAATPDGPPTSAA